MTYPSWLRSSTRRATVVLALTAALALLVAISSSSPSRRAAPPLPAQALQGRPITLAALRGKPALIEFFASWCGPCVSEAPALAQTERAVLGRATVVAVDWSDSPRYAMAFIRRFHWSFPVLADPHGSSGYAYGIHGLPSGFVLNPDGRIVRFLIGPQPAHKLVAAIDQAD
jgi:cytochrome c biogenesis protein CcmG, thiol:disulfide interchange protein DsbE